MPWSAILVPFVCDTLFHAYRPYCHPNNAGFEPRRHDPLPAEGAPAGWAPGAENRESPRRTDCGIVPYSANLRHSRIHKPRGMLHLRSCRNVRRRVDERNQCAPLMVGFLAGCRAVEKNPSRMKSQSLHWNVLLQRPWVVPRPASARISPESVELNAGCRILRGWR
jgi:hypothetical protein